MKLAGKHTKRNTPLLTLPQPPPHLHLHFVCPLKPLASKLNRRYHFARSSNYGNEARKAIPGARFLLDHFIFLNFETFSAPSPLPSFLIHKYLNLFFSTFPLHLFSSSARKTSVSSGFLHDPVRVFVYAVTGRCLLLLTINKTENICFPSPSPSYVGFFLTDFMSGGLYRDKMDMEKYNGLVRKKERINWKAMFCCVNYDSHVISTFARMRTYTHNAHSICRKELSLSFSLFLSLSLIFTLSLLRAHTHCTHTLSLSYTNTHTHTPSRACALYIL